MPISSVSLARSECSTHVPDRGAASTLITVALSANIGAPHERVWRALVDPAERPAWDERILGEVTLSRATRSAGNRTGTPATQRKSIRKTHWRFKLGSVPLVLSDEIVSANRHDRLMSRISIGSLHFEQTLTLHTEDDETGPHTRVGLKIVAHNSIPVIGEVVPRLEVQKLVIGYVDTTLRQLRKYCEADA